MNTVKPNPVRKAIIGMVLGGIAGAAGMMLLTTQVKAFDLGEDVVIAGGAGMLCLLIGLFVLIGSLAPGAGAKLLNVEDEEELREARSMTIGSSAMLTMFGAAMLVLAFSAPTGPIPSSFAFAIVLLAIAVGFWGTARVWKHYDELHKAVSIEGGNWALCLLLPVILVWGAMAHFGWVIPIKPLSLIGVSAFVMLLGTFIAAGLRGMLKPR